MKRSDRRGETREQEHRPQEARHAAERASRVARSPPRAAVLHQRPDDATLAMASISTRTPRGSPATATVERAGRAEPRTRA